MTDDKNNHINNFLKFHCNDCNVEFYKLDSTDKIDECIICGSTNIDSCNYSDINILPTIPFCKDINFAVKEYKKKVMFNPLIPFIFKKKMIINSMKKIYIPATLVNANISGNVSYIAFDNKKKKNNKYNVTMSVNIDYDNLVVSKYSVVDKMFNNISEYDYSKIDNNCIDNFCYICGDLNDNDIINIVNKKIMRKSLNIVKNNINHQFKKIDTNNLDINIKSNDNILVPIYLLTIKYNDKDYLYMVNGQSGESTVSLTFGKKNIIISCLILFGLIFLLSFLIAYFL